MQAHCGVLREGVLARRAHRAFGHRLMRDVIVPGGLARDLDEEGRASIRAALDSIRPALSALIELYDNTASLPGSHRRHRHRRASARRDSTPLAAMWGALRRAPSMPAAPRRLWPVS